MEFCLALKIMSVYEVKLWRHLVTVPHIGYSQAFFTAYFVMPKLIPFILYKVYESELDVGPFC